MLTSEFQLLVTHYHTLYQPDLKHEGCQTTASVTDERQRQPGNRLHIEIYANIYCALKEDQDSNPESDHGAGDIACLLRRTDTTPDDEQQREDDQDPADHAKFLGGRRKNKICMTYFEEAQL